MTRVLLLLFLATGAHARELRILFVGNSLTYFNDMPRMVERLGRVRTESVAFPDYSLEDHLRDPRTREALAKKWDVVVLQQGPSAMVSSRQQLLRDVRAFADRTRAKIALLTVWPSRARSGDFDRVIESYRLAAEAVGGVVIPAGVAWKQVLEQRPDIALYSEDGFHPSKTGSYLMALTVYRTLVGPLPSARDDAQRYLVSVVAGIAAAPRATLPPPREDRAH